ncbi:MAG TPA: M55 family metallopeptidase, partial [Candidatus Thermoplasmatota archaeon]
MPGHYVVLADLDGAAGVRNPHECYPNFSEYAEFGVPNMAADANAAARGLFAGGADAVTLVDGHLLGQNLISAQVEAPAQLGKGTLLDELERGPVAGVFLTGLHGKTGAPNSFSSHTIAPFLAARVDGDVVSDAQVVALLAGSYGAPLVGASGDWVACEELHWSMPDLPVAPTKTGFDRSTVRHHNPQAARAALEEVAERAARAAPPRPAAATAPFRLELSLGDEEWAQRAAAAVDGMARRQRRVLVHAGSDFRLASQFLAQAVGSTFPGWVDG